MIWLSPFPFNVQTFGVFTHVLQLQWPVYSSKTVSALALLRLNIAASSASNSFQGLHWPLFIQLLYPLPNPPSSFFYLPNIYSVPTKCQELFRKALKLVRTINRRDS